MTEDISKFLMNSFAEVAEKRGLTLQEAFIEAVDLWIETRKTKEGTS